jgi:hypothetical protein
MLHSCCGEHGCGPVCIDTTLQAHRLGFQLLPRSPTSCYELHAHWQAHAALTPSCCRTAAGIPAVCLPWHSAQMVTSWLLHPATAGKR